MVRKALYAAGAVTLLAAGIAVAKDHGILYPNWSPPTKGTYSEPAGTLGKKPSAAMPWTTTVFTMRWVPNADPFEYICQDNNHGPELMIGSQSEVDNTRFFVP